ncbi:hypothetical protein JOD52_000677 [Brachybacterium muris]|uniref:hypothetical protein n=1 Tax=Brachybacterium muris TaxID=219301 RepID=UPI0019563E6E|nr:hypothetical protein [Brachybacterium muris]MCT2295774.1 hypothetical protein [Brachybacterium muris]
MNKTIRSASARINVVVGPLVALMGVAVAIAAVALSIVLESMWPLLLFIPALMGIGAGLFLLRAALRSGLRIDGDGFTWQGFTGPAHSLRWDQLHRLVPPPGRAPRTVAIAQLRDGSQVEVIALWESPTSPMAVAGLSDQTATRKTLVEAHRYWLAQQR